MIAPAKVALVAWREYLENVRTKAFIFGVVLTPIIMGLIVVAPLLFPDEDRRVVIVDGTGQLYPLLQAHFEAENQARSRGRTVLVEDEANRIPPDAPDAEARLAAAVERLEQRVRDGSGGADALYGAVIIEPSFLLDDQAVRDGSAVRWVTLHPTDQKVPSSLRQVLAILRRPIRVQSLLARELARDPGASSQLPLTMEPVDVDEGAAAAPHPRRLHVLDGTGQVLPAVEAVLAALRGELPEGAATGLPKPGGVPALPWSMDTWKAPAIEGVEPPARVAMMQAGLDPDSLPIALGGGGEEARRVSFDEAKARFLERVRAGELDAFLLVKRDLLARARGPEPGDAVLYVRRGLPALELAGLGTLLRHVLWGQRRSAEILAANVTPSVTTFNPERGERYEQTDVLAKVVVPFAFVMLLFYGVFGIAQALLNSVIEEKSNRIIEVLLSSLTPLELMLGKIVGVGLVGFTLVALWSLGGYATAAHQMGADFLSQHLRPSLAAFFVIYYVLGFLFLASLVAAIGATCNTIKEAQNYMSVLSILYVIPMLSLMPVTEQPEGAMARALSFIPPLTPFVMLNRLAASKAVPTWEIAATIAILAVSIVGAVWLSARVFRVGILMYGKPPKLRELLRWITRA